MLSACIQMHERKPEARLTQVPAVAVLGLPVQGHGGGLRDQADGVHGEGHCAAHAFLAARGVLPQAGSGQSAM